MPLPDTSVTTRESESSSDDYVEEVSSDFAAGDGAGSDLRIREGRHICRHQAALDVRGDVQLLLVVALAFFGERQLRIVDERGGVSGDGLEQVVVDFRQSARAQAIIEIEESEQIAFARGRTGATLAQRDADYAADAVGNDAVCHRLRVCRVSDDVVVGGRDSAADRAVRERSVLEKHLAAVAAAERELHFTRRILQKDESALHFCELQRGFYQRG